MFHLPSLQCHFITQLSCPTEHKYLLPIPLLFTQYCPFLNPCWFAPVNTTTTGSLTRPLFGVQLPQTSASRLEFEEFALSHWFACYSIWILQVFVGFLLALVINRTLEHKSWEEDILQLILSNSSPRARTWTNPGQGFHWQNVASESLNQMISIDMYPD